MYRYWHPSYKQFEFPYPQGNTTGVTAAFITDKYTEPSEIEYVRKSLEYFKFAIV